MRNHFLNKILKNSVNNNGDFKINLDKKYYSSRLKINENKIILNLLNSIQNKKNFNKFIKCSLNIKDYFHKLKKSPNSFFESLYIE